MTRLSFLKTHKFKISKKELSLIFLGVLLLFVTQEITSLITSTFLAHFLNQGYPPGLPASDYQYVTVSHTPTDIYYGAVALSEILWLISILIPGIVLGWIAKERGWYLGALAGLVVFLIFLAANATFLFLQDSTYNPYASRGLIQSQKIANLIGTLESGLMLLFLMTLGGLIGSKFHKHHNIIRSQARKFF